MQAIHRKCKSGFGSLPFQFIHLNMSAESAINRKVFILSPSFMDYNNDLSALGRSTPSKVGLFKL